MTRDLGPLVGEVVARYVTYRAMEARHPNTRHVPVEVWAAYGRYAAMLITLAAAFEHALFAQGVPVTVVIVAHPAP